MTRIMMLVFLLQAGISVNAQNFGKILKQATSKDTSNNKSGLNKIVSAVSAGNKNDLTQTDVANGLKDALQVATERGTSQLSAPDGFFKDAAIKILMPPEAQRVEKTLRSIGLNKEVDDVILAMNRAAEDAVKSATPIFVNAIKGMSIRDAFGILNGGDSAATKYLYEKTITSLTTAFKPVVARSLTKVEAAKYWNSVFTSYNKVPFVRKIDPNLTTYVTDRALSGIFYQIALEEQKIRKDPLARTTDILKKVFSK